jgi:hypothetical protein
MIHTTSLCSKMAAVNPIKNLEATLEHQGSATQADADASGNVHPEL